MYLRLSIILLVVSFVGLTGYLHGIYYNAAARTPAEGGTGQVVALARSYDTTPAPYGETVTDYAPSLKHNPSDILIKRKIELILDILNSGQGDAEGFAAGERSSAVEELNAVLRAVPSHMDTKELVHLSNSAAVEMERAVVESHQKKGIDYFLADEMESAIRLWDAVLKLDPGNKSALEYKKRAEAVIERLNEIKEKKGE